MEMALTFNDVTFSPVPEQNGIWIRAVELAKALGYARTDIVTKLYHENKDEFASDMTQVIEISNNTASVVSGKLINKTRIFSLRGCHLMAMLARTPVAKSFRKWVLDVLDRLAKEEREAVKPDPTAPITVAQQDFLRAIIKARVHHEEMDKWELSRLCHIRWCQFNRRFGLKSFTQLPQSKMTQAIEFLVRFNPEPPRKVEAKETVVEPKALPEPEIDAQTYMDGKILFEILGKTKWDLENVASRLMLSYPPRNAFLPPEKALLYENLCDCVRAATAGVNTAIYNVRSACRLRSRVKFVDR